MQMVAAAKLRRARMGKRSYYENLWARVHAALGLHVPAEPQATAPGSPRHVSSSRLLEAVSQGLVLLAISERLGEANKHTYLKLRETGASRFRSWRAGERGRDGVEGGVELRSHPRQHRADHAVCCNASQGRSPPLGAWQARLSDAGNDGEGHQSFGLTMGDGKGRVPCATLRGRQTHRSNQ